MTVESTTRKQNFVLDQVTAEFDFTFRALITEPTSIKCKNTTGSTITVLTYTTHYTVTVSTDGIGGIVWLVDPAAVSKGTLTVYRESTNTQQSDYDDYNQFPADTLETDIDRRTLISQELAEDIARALTLPISVSGVDAELPVPVASKVIGWNSAADGLVNIENAADSVTAAASHATTALNAKTAAETAETNAETAETNAETAETNAETAETNASSYSTTALNTLVVSINTQTADYTLAVSDVNKLVDMNKATAVTLTVPLNSVIAIPTGSVIAIRQLGAGQVTISPTNGSVTINKETGLKTTGQHAVASLLKTGTDTWLALGALEA